MNRIPIFFFLTILVCACKDAERTPISLLSNSDKYIEVKELDQFLDQTMDSLGIPGISFAVINDAEVVYHRASGIANLETGEKVHENSIFEAASISKSVFAYFTLKMKEKSIIDLGRPLSLMWEDPDFKEFPQTRGISAEMVLSHKTGFPNWRWFSKVPDSLEVKRGDFFMVKNPGEFNYSGEGYQYLARVLAHNNYVNMNELAGLVADEVFNPLGMDNSFFVWDDYLLEHKVWGHYQGKQDGRDWGSGLPHITSKTIGAAGSLHTEAMDFSQFIIALLEKEGLSAETFKDMFAKHTEVPQNDPFYTKHQVIAWGLGLEIFKINSDTYYGHGGNNTGFTSYFLMNKENKNAYVFFINCEKGDEFNKALINFFIKN